MHTIKPQEETILEQEVDWDKGLRQRGSASTDSWGAARRVTEGILGEYNRASNLGRVLSSLGEEENFVLDTFAPIKALLKDSCGALKVCCNFLRKTFFFRKPIKYKDFLKMDKSKGLRSNYFQSLLVF